jgi:hypothetical protein
MSTVGNMSVHEATITVRDALRLIWEADRYPILGNEDRIVAERLGSEALAKAANAVASAGDPPEFSRWLNVLRSEPLSNVTREEILPLLYDLFDPDNEV